MGSRTKPTAGLNVPGTSSSTTMDGDMEDATEGNDTSENQNRVGQTSAPDGLVSSNDNNDNNDDDDNEEEDSDSDVSSNDYVDSDSDSDLPDTVDSSEEETVDNLEEAAMQVSSFLIQSDLQEVYEFLNLFSHALEVISSHLVLRSISSGRTTSALEELQNLVQHLLSIQSGQREE